MTEPTTEWILGSRYADLTISFLFAFAFPILRTVLVRTVYQPIGLRVLSSGKKDDDSSDTSSATMSKLKKWNESCWKISCFGLLALSALSVSYDAPWFTDRKKFWVGCTQLPCDYYVSKKILLFYCLETGFYLQAIPFLIWVETRRKDFWENMVHHLATVALLVYSYHLNLTRVGVMIILLHDICDVPLEAAKLAKYAKKETAANVFFGLFFVIWVIMRMIIFPLHIIRSTWYDVIELVAIPFNIPPQPHHGILNGLLIVLFILHCYWSYLIWLILRKALTSTKVDDIREDDD